MDGILIALAEYIYAGFEELMKYKIVEELNQLITVSLKDV